MLCIFTRDSTYSGGFRGYAWYAAAYPIDWTGCIFVTFNFCPIIWIFGHRLIPCVAAWVQKQNTEPALMTGADTDRSFIAACCCTCTRSGPSDSYCLADRTYNTLLWQTGLQGCCIHPIYGSRPERPVRAFRSLADHTVQSIACRQSFLHSSTSMHSMLCYRR